LLVSDDADGRIYRVAYQQGRDGRTATQTQRTVSAPAVGTAGVEPRPGGNELAWNRPETRDGDELTVRSTAFNSGAAIPEPYSEYGERFSPALSWRGAPSATKSFTVLLEDPDAIDPRPFVHWVVYNLSGTTTSLPESVPPVPRLKEPRGAMQGRNSRGQIGYMGPRPPAGDSAHHYHFQVFALDVMLSLDPGAPREAVVSAMRGHVLARGDLVGTFVRPR
jgi:Raf kinase inhibitor-like YbhB/YbcL family protein